MRVFEIYFLKIDQIIALMLIKLSDGENRHQNYEYVKQPSIFIDKISKPIWFLFPGLGGKWKAMAKALILIEIFAP